MDIKKAKEIISDYNKNAYINKEANKAMEAVKICPNNFIVRIEDDVNKMYFNFNLYELSNLGIELKNQIYAALDKIERCTKNNIKELEEKISK